MRKYKIIWLLVGFLPTLLIFSLSMLKAAPEEGKTIIAKRTTADPASVNDPFWSSVATTTIITSGRSEKGGHGALKNRPALAVKAAFNDQYVYTYFSWEDTTADNYKWWQFNGTSWSKQAYEQDRLYLIWPITDVAGKDNKKFAEAGCSALCHRYNTADSKIYPTAGSLSNCGACHSNSDEVQLFGESHRYLDEPAPTCAGCHADRSFIETEGTVTLGADMVAPAGGAYDIWHFKAGTASNIGLADDQVTANGTKRGNDASPGLDSNNENAAKTAPKYIWPLGSGKDYRDLVKKSDILNGNLVQLNTDGTGTVSGEPVPAGTSVKFKIVNDIATEAVDNRDILVSKSYDGKFYRVVFKRKLTNGSAKDYQFKFNEANLFSVAVTDNSEIKHAGSSGPHRLILDTQAPSVPTLTAPAFSTNASKTTAFNLSWKASDSGSGIGSYEVQYSTDGVNWATWKKTAATSGVFSGSSGKTYYFRGRAFDGAGNVSAWSASTRTTVPYDDSDYQVSHSAGWHTVYDPTTAHYLGSRHEASVAGQWLTFTFTGKELKVITPKGPKLGAYEVYFGSTKVATVDSYSATFKPRQITFSKSWSTASTRKVKLRVVGTANRPKVVVDGFAVR